ncbi:hypothetical protein [Geothermobacter hydrogeniphilus]|uniref:hypothetical protein n=1 Tax=Geothermobacter hydrogeniphilus TaxID=1969733 RepID=UPI00111BF9CB|nr:hypothetical protein [Geothermobacter hydrogeniphilus]
MPFLPLLLCCPSALHCSGSACLGILEKIISFFSITKTTFFSGDVAGLSPFLLLAAEPSAIHRNLFGKPLALSAD